LVYVNVGRMIDGFKRGQVRIILTDCINKEEEMDLKKLKKRETLDQKKKNKTKCLKDKLKENEAQDEEDISETPKKKRK